MIGEIGVGHIGGALSLCEVLSVLYFDQMNVDPGNAKMENRDRFGLSKATAWTGFIRGACLKGLPADG